MRAQPCTKSRRGISHRGQGQETDMMRRKRSISRLNIVTHIGHLALVIIKFKVCCLFIEIFFFPSRITTTV